MTAPVRRKLKQITLTFDPLGDNLAFQVQVTEWHVNNNTDDPDRVFTFGGEASTTQDPADPDYSLALNFLADWTADGISTYLTNNDGAEIAVDLEAHTDVAASPTAPHPKWSGTVVIKAPSAGGEARANDTQEVEMPYLDKPTFSTVTA